jgi:hypothetical protein
MILAKLFLVGVLGGIALHRIKCYFRDRRQRLANQQEG